MKLVLFFYLCLLTVVYSQIKPSAEDVEKTAKETKEQYDKAAADAEKAKKTYENAEKEAKKAREEAEKLKAAGGEAYSNADAAAKEAEGKSAAAKTAYETATKKADDLKSEFDGFRETLGSKAEDIWRGLNFISGSTISSFVGSAIIVILARFI